MPLIVEKTIAATFLQRARLTPRIMGFQFPNGKGGWNTATFRQFFDECRLTFFGLHALGVKPGDRVAILSNTRFEWSLSDMAIVGARAITVPVYASNTAEDVAYVLEHSEARAVFVENSEQLEKVLSVRSKLPSLEKIVVYEPVALATAAEQPDVLTFAALRELGKRAEASSPSLFEENLVAAKPGDVFTICYTSGTTGTPKGVMITHDNLMSVLEDVQLSLKQYLRMENDVILSFLPFSHIFGRVESMITHAIGWRQVFAESMERVVQNMNQVRPTLIFAVPRFFERALNRIEQGALNAPIQRRRLYEWGINAGRSYFRSPSLRSWAELQAARASIFRLIRRRFGGRLRFAVSGGAPLAKEIGEFFCILGIPVLEGYGLTETCAPISVNDPDHLRFGSVGRPLPEVAIRIAEDGEILVKSRKVFKGYFKDPESTQEALKSGWLYTGDIGHLDRDGYLFITGRKKDLIITSGGKNIAPQKIENLASQLPYIHQFVVHGDRRNFLSALVTLDRERVIQYANENQILFSAYEELVHHPKIQNLVQSSVHQLNSQLASHETVKKFVILPHDFTVESGEMTPSLKVKRNVVSARYRGELDGLYEAPRNPRT